MCPFLLKISFDRMGRAGNSKCVHFYSRFILIRWVGREIQNVSIFTHRFFLQVGSRYLYSVTNRGQDMYPINVKYTMFENCVPDSA